MQPTSESIPCCGDITTSLGRLFQELIFLLSIIGMSSGITCTFYPSSFPCDFLEKGSRHPFCIHPLITGTCWYGLPPLNLLFSRLNKPNCLSLSSSGRLPSPLIIWALWGLFQLATSFFCSKNPKLNTKF